MPATTARSLIWLIWHRITAFSTEQEHWLLDHYFNAASPDATRHAFDAMKCASLLRETLWSMVSEIHSTIDFDFVEYTRENLERFDQQWLIYQAA